MRTCLIGLALLGLAACNEPIEESERTDEAALAVIDKDAVILRPDGLVVGPEAFYFAAGQREVENSLARVLGKPGESGQMADCGGGPIQSTTFADSLTVNFRDGSLIGWLLRNEPGEIALSNGISIGTSRERVEDMADFTMIEDSTIGEEFTVGDELAGLFADGKVAALYAGAQCFFR